MELNNLIGNQLLFALLFGCFVQVATIFVLLRVALGLNQIDFAIVTLVLSLVLSAALVEKKLDGFKVQQLSQPQSATLSASPQLKEFMLEHSDARVLSQFSQIFPQQEDRLESDQGVFSLQAVYLFSQLKRALSLGLILILPLFLIDFIVAIALNLVGIQGLSSQTVSIPLKLLLLAFVDAWDLIISKLLVGFV
jgi:flagellar biosynthetic protein FliP